MSKDELERLVRWDFYDLGFQDYVRQLISGWVFIADEIHFMDDKNLWGWSSCRDLGLYGDGEEREGINDN